MGSAAKAGRMKPLSMEMTALEAFGLLVRGLAAKADARQRAILTSDDPEAVHAARVALRKLRSVLRGFDPMLAGKPATELRDEAARRFRRLGPLRDADVRAMALADAAGADAARAEAERFRAEIRAELTQEAPDAMSDLVARSLGKPDKLCRGARRARLASAPVPVIAALALQVAWTELLTFGSDLDSLTEEERHEFRKRMKDMRYLMDFFHPFWRKTKKMRRVIPDLQEVLGLLNDLAVMRQEAGDGPYHLADMTAQEQASRKVARRYWAKLRALRPWWCGPLR